MNLFSFPIASKWKMILVFLSLIAIVLYLIMKIMNVPLAEVPLVIIIIIGGIPLFLQIVSKLFQGNLGADSLAAIALVTGTLLHEYLAVALIILMLAGGQTLELYAMRQASSVLMALAARMPTKAHRKSKERIEDITLDDIGIGDDLVIYPYEICPVDGNVVEGHGMMDESYLTGEPYMISKAPGTSVISGAINGESPLTIQATRLPPIHVMQQLLKYLKKQNKKTIFTTIRRPDWRHFCPISLNLRMCRLVFHWRFDAVSRSSRHCNTLPFTHCHSNYLDQCDFYGSKTKYYYS